MFIKKSRVQSVSGYIADMKVGEEYIVAYEIKSEKQEILEKIGFNINAESGETILPKICGNISKFNSEGEFIALKDQPKESRYIGSKMWSWKEWRGRYDYILREKEVDIYRDCYPRKHILPPSVEVTYVVINGKNYIISPVFIKGTTDIELVKHTVNLFLEFFGECYISGRDLEKIPNIKTKRVNWKMLPTGEYPWEVVREKIQSANLKGGTQNSIIIERQKYIYELGASVCYVGTWGFSDYVAYSFEGHDLIILESLYHGNAIYIFNQDWKRFSKLSKAEIINENLHLIRIIHSTGWRMKLKNFIESYNKKVA